MDWLKYTSLFYYSYGALVNLEIGGGPAFECSSSNVSTIPVCHMDGVTAFDGRLHVESVGLILPVWADVIVAMVVFVFCRMASYVIFRYFRRPGMS